jgi:hypothetical protein
MLKPLVVAASAAAIVAAIPLRAEIVEQVLVKVNGEIITKTEFEARQVAELRNRPELAKSNAASADLQRAIAQITSCCWSNAAANRATRSAMSSSPESSET